MMLSTRQVAFGWAVSLNQQFRGASVADAALESVFQRARDLMQSGANAEACVLLEDFSQKVARASERRQIGTLPDSPAASIVVVSYKDVPGVEPALEAIGWQARAENCEVILVDNGNDKLEAIGRRTLDGAVMVRAPFQTGCSLGRNLGAHFARAPYLIFVDDDGLIEPDFVASLLRAARETGAVAVRGRVAPLTPGTPEAVHYDLGERRLATFIGAEGASLWQRQVFCDADGFHPLLYGHEGHDLCARLFPFHGPFAFLYEPGAVLRHDYADDPKARASKEARYNRNVAFVQSRVPEAWTIHTRIGALARDGRGAYLMARHAAAAVDPASGPVSILTTARNAALWLDDFTKAWKAQSQADFQLVFVDDGSSDGTADRIAAHWRGDERLTLVRAPAEGRGAALNTALAHAAHEICLIADVDDLSTPDRIARTSAAFRDNPEADYLSFLAFNEDDMLRIGSPRSPVITDMDVRALFGMPASFPSFAFRKSRFPLAFDASLPGGIDCRWLKQHLVERGVRGMLVHEPVVYYRRHDGQITSQHNDCQREIRRELIHWSFSRVLGELTDRDREIIEMLMSGRAPAGNVDIAGWVAAFLARNDELGVFDRVALGAAMLERATPLSPGAPMSAGSADRQVRELRRVAERHIASGEFKQARRALRDALGILDAKAIWRRLLASNRYAIVRYLTRSTPFKG
jgi:glycosyltransferase involved in cell wall biosynthesis